MTESDALIDRALAELGRRTFPIAVFVVEGVDPDDDTPRLEFHAFDDGVGSKREREDQFFTAIAEAETDGSCIDVSGSFHAVTVVAAFRARIESKSIARFEPRDSPFLVTIDWVGAGIADTPVTWTPHSPIRSVLATGARALTAHPIETSYVIASERLGRALVSRTTWRVSARTRSPTDTPDPHLGVAA